MTYLPQLEQEQSEPQLPITQVSIGGGSKWGKRETHTARGTGASAFALHDDCIGCFGGGVGDGKKLECVVRCDLDCLLVNDAFWRWDKAVFYASSSHSLIILPVELYRSTFQSCVQSSLCAFCALRSLCGVWLPWGPLTASFVR